MTNTKSLKENAARTVGAAVLALSTIAGSSALTASSVVTASVAVNTLMTSSAEAKPNGRTATVIQFAGGSFELNNSGEWLEFGNGSNNVRYKFRETHRDDWSIYGVDSSRNMKIQMDLHRKKIKLEWPGHAMQDQYNITSSDDRVNGRKASYVAMQGGSFRKEGGNWVEYDPSGKLKAKFRETNRDMWSVYARDDSRKMDMQIDLHRRQIRLAWPNKPMFDWKKVQDAR